MTYRPLGACACVSVSRSCKARDEAERMRNLENDLILEALPFDHDVHHRRKHAFQAFGVEAVGLGAAVLARHGNACGMNDVSLDATLPQPAGEPEAVPAGLKGNGNARDRCGLLSARRWSHQRLHDTMPLAAVTRCSELSYETGRWSIRGLRPKSTTALHTAHDRRCIYLRTHRASAPYLRLKEFPIAD